MRVKVLVIPVYRRHWVYHAWVEQPKDAAFEALLAQPWWRAPGSLQDKLNVLTVQMNGKASLLPWVEGCDDVIAHVRPGAQPRHSQQALCGSSKRR